MNITNTRCPPDADLRDFGLGKLDAAQTETIGQHIETCADCRNRVAGLSGDTFVGRLKQADGTAKPVKRERTFVPGESLANAANSTDGMEDGLPRPSRTEDGRGRPSHIRDGLGSPSSVSAPPELENHPDYELIKELGQGGMGTVYLAKNRMMDRMEVLKVISKALLTKPGALERFQQEIRSAAKLAHPNIVAAYSVLRPGDLLVFAMEYVKGQDLEKVVHARGYLPVANAAFYVHQVANGLQHAFEKGMVHRDIKPNNLMLAIEGKKHTVKILDFGLAKATSEKSAEGGLTKSGQMLGTPDYVAPEQTLDAHQADIRADIYSLGCTLYFLLSGGPPFQETSLYAILEAHHKRDPKPLNLVRPEVPVELAAVVARMMAKKPADRYQTPGDVAKALVPFFKPGQAPLPAKPRDEGDYPQYAMETVERPLSTTPVGWALPTAPTAASQPRMGAGRDIGASLGTAPPTDAMVGNAHPTPSAMPVPLGNAPVLVQAAPPVEDFSVSINVERPSAKRRNWWSALLPWQQLAIAAGSAASVLLLGVVFLLPTRDGAIRVEINDPNIEVAIKGTDIVLRQADNGHDVKLSSGEKTLIVERGDFKFETDKLVLKRGETITLVVEVVAGRIDVKQERRVIGRNKLPSRAAALAHPRVAEESPPAASAGAETAGLTARFPCGIRDAIGGGWSIEGNELVRRANRPESAILFGNPNWTDYDLHFEAKIVNGWLLRTYFRYQDEKNFHSYNIGGWNNTWQIVDTMEKGAWGKRQCERPLELAKDTWYQIHINVRGQTGRCFLNGGSVDEVKMPHLSHGRVGFLLEKNASYRFRNSTVTAPDGTVLVQGLPDVAPTKRDEVAPTGDGAITDSDGRLDLDEVASSRASGGVGDSPSAVPATSDPRSVLHVPADLAHFRFDGNAKDATGGGV